MKLLLLSLILSFSAFSAQWKCTDKKADGTDVEVTVGYKNSFPMDLGAASLSVKVGNTVADSTLGQSGGNFVMFASSNTAIYHAGLLAHSSGDVPLIYVFFDGETLSNSTHQGGTMVCTEI